MAAFKWTIVLLVISTSLHFNALGNDSAGKENRTSAAGYSPVSPGRSMDSLLPVRIRLHQNEEIAPDLLQAESAYTQTGNMRKALVSLLRIGRIKNGLPGTKAKYKLFSDLAVFSARLKLYPLAMKCYYKAIQYQRMNRLMNYRISVFADNDAVNDIDSVNGIDSANIGSTDRDSANMVSFAVNGETESGNDDYLMDSSSYDHLINMDASFLAVNREGSPFPSEPVRTSDLWESFSDGKTAVSYALIVHVKQPVPGKRKAFTHINNVGHTFITLIKYNSDHTVVSRSFGFYPHKTGFFSATPVHPNSSATFKDDALHDWDEVVGKFISRKRFQKIIETLKKYDQLTYNLNRNNCTDFGLVVAGIGGIGIRETRGSWPLGRGNNPANAGQSMLEGKFRNTDPGYGEALFVCNNLSEFKHH